MTFLAGVTCFIVGVRLLTAGSELLTCAATLRTSCVIAGLSVGAGLVAALDTFLVVV